MDRSRLRTTENHLLEDSSVLSGPALSRTMKQALTSLVRNNQSDIDGRTATALISRGLITKTGKLTVSGWEHGVELLPLHEQCGALGITFRVTSQEAPADRPEIETVRRLAERGLTAYFTENTYGVHVVWFLAYPITRILELITRNRLYGLVPLKKTGHRRLLALTACLGRLLIRRSVVARTYRRLNERRHVGDGFFTDLWPIEFYELVVERLGRKALTAIIRMTSTNPNAYSVGWPDITCFDPNGILFIEVKTTDRLQRSQIRTIPALLSATGMRLECWRLGHPDETDE